MGSDLDFCTRLRWSAERKNQDLTPSLWQEAVDRDLTVQAGTRQLDARVLQLAALFPLDRHANLIRLPLVQGGKVLAPFRQQRRQPAGERQRFVAAVRRLHHWNPD